MKKILAILLAVTALLSLAACTTTTTTIETPTAAPSEGGNESEAVKDVLRFIEKDEIYFDIHLTKGYFDKTSVKVGDKVMTSSGKTAYTGSEEILFEGTTDKDDDVYVVIIAAKAGEKETVDYAVAEASSLALQLKTRIPIHKQNKDKVLVVITDTKGDYDKNLNDALGGIIVKALGE